MIKLLLKYGLDPNLVVGEDNIMDCLKYVDNEFLAADTLALLLEHGGNPDIIIPYERESLFDLIAGDVFFDAIEQYDRYRFASLVHYLMVLIGYGASYREGQIQVFKEYDSPELFDLQKLRAHRNYYFGLIHLENHKALVVYDKETLWEVARMT